MRSKNTWHNILVSLLSGTYLAVSLSGCSEVRRAFGVDRAVPDEFNVPEGPSLVLPPDYELRPPQSGAPISQNKPVQDAVRETLLMNKMVGQDMGADRTFPVIEKVEVASAEQSNTLSENTVASEEPASSDTLRKTVDQEATQAEEPDDRPEFIKKLLFWQDKKPAGETIDPTTEQQRLNTAGTASDTFASDQAETTQEAKDILMGTTTVAHQPTPPATPQETPRVQLTPPAAPAPQPPVMVPSFYRQSELNQGPRLPMASAHQTMPQPVEEPIIVPSAEMPAPAATPAPTTAVTHVPSVQTVEAVMAQTTTKMEESVCGPTAPDAPARPDAKTAQELYPTQWSSLGPKKLMPPAHTASGASATATPQEPQTVLLTNVLPQLQTEPAAKSKKIHKPKKKTTPKKRQQKPSAPTTETAPTAQAESTPAELDSLPPMVSDPTTTPPTLNASDGLPTLTAPEQAAPEQTATAPMVPAQPTVETTLPPQKGVTTTILHPGGAVMESFSNEAPTPIGQSL